MRRLFSSWSLLVMCFVLMVGCHTGRRGAGTRHGFLPSADPVTELISNKAAKDLGYRVSNRIKIDLPAQAYVASVSLHGDILVLIEMPDNVVKILDAQTLEIIAVVSISAREDQLYEPVRVGNLLYINTNEYIYVINLKDGGQIIAFKELPSFVTSKPLLLDDQIIFGGYDNRVFAMDTRDLLLGDSYLMQGRLVTSPIRVGDFVFAVDEKGHYVLLNGMRLNRRIYGGRTLENVSAQPVAGPRGIYVASEDRSLYCLDKNTLQDRWRYHTGAPLKYAPSLLDDLLFVPVSDGKKIDVINTKTGPVDGKAMWQMDYCHPILIKGDRLLLNRSDRVETVNKYTGTSISSVPTVSVKFSLVGPNDTIYLISPYGNVYMLESND